MGEVLIYAKSSTGNSVTLQNLNANQSKIGKKIIALNHNHHYKRKEPLTDYDVIKNFSWKTTFSLKSPVWHCARTEAAE